MLNLKIPSSKPVVPESNALLINWSADSTSTIEESFLIFTEFELLNESKDNIEIFGLLCNCIFNSKDNSLRTSIF